MVRMAQTQGAEIVIRYPTDNIFVYIVGEEVARVRRTQVEL